MNRLRNRAYQAAQGREWESELMIRDMQAAARAIREHVAARHRARRAAIARMQRDMRRPGIGAAVVVLGMCLVALSTVIVVIRHLATP